jgi:uncharacterized membrane protein
MARFTSEAARKQFHDAIVAIEAVSSVEVEVAVRGAARRSLVPHLIVALVAATAMLGVTLYSDTEYELWMIWLLPLAAAVVAGLLVDAAAPLYRLLLPAGVRRRHVGEAARVAFYELGIAATHRRTGVLVLIALRERAVELVPDIAAAKAIDRAMLDRWGARLAATLGAGGVATAKTLAALAPDFAAALPHVAGQEDELPDDVIAIHPRGARTGKAKDVTP